MWQDFLNMKLWRLYGKPLTIFKNRYCKKIFNVYNNEYKIIKQKIGEENYGRKK